MKHAAAILSTGLLLVISVARAATTAPTKAPTTPTSPSTRPTDIRRGLDMNSDPEQRRSAAYERLIKRIEPTGHGDIARLPMYLDFAKREFVEDTRTFAFDVTGETSPAGQTALRGFVEFREQKDALDRFLTHLGLDSVRDDTELLPSPQLGDRKYGLVTAARAFLYDHPTGKREQLTECLQGDVIYVLKDAGGGQLLCHAPDGYVGYIAADAVRRVDEASLAQLESVVPVRHVAEIDRIIDTAKKSLGVKYIWGGNSPEGVDCSGLVRTAFRAVQIDLPRDADQQALVGRLVGTRWHRSSMRRGDTLYFLGRNGQIHHTALYLGDGQFIEATEPVAKISSFNPVDKNFSEKREKSFCFAKRILQ